MTGKAFDECEELLIDDSRNSALGNNVRDDQEFENEALGHGLPRALGTLYADSASWQWAWTYPLTLEAVLHAHADALGHARGLRPRWFGRRYLLRAAGAVLTACTDRDEPCTEWEIGVVDASKPGSAATVLNPNERASGAKSNSSSCGTGARSTAAQQRSAPSDTVELLAMSAGDIRWLFATGYGEGPFAIHDRLKNQMRVVSEASEVALDDWDTEYLVWIPTRKGQAFARKALRASSMYHGPVPDKETGR